MDRRLNESDVLKEATAKCREDAQRANERLEIIEAKLGGLLERDRRARIDESLEYMRRLK